MSPAPRAGGGRRSATIRQRRPANDRTGTSVDAGPGQNVRGSKTVTAGGQRGLAVGPVSMTGRSIVVIDVVRRREELLLGAVRRIDGGSAEPLPLHRRPVLTDCSHASVVDRIEYLQYADQEQGWHHQQRHRTTDTERQARCCTSVEGVAHSYRTVPARSEVPTPVPGPGVRPHSGSSRALPGRAAAGTHKPRSK